MTSAIHISVKAEPIFQLGSFVVTNSLFFSWVVMLVFLLIGIYYARSLKKVKKSGFFYVLHLFFTTIHNLIESVLHEKTAHFYPLLAAYFFYILINNWMGILPTVGSLMISPKIENSISTELHQNSPVTTEGIHNAQVDQEASEGKELVAADQHKSKIPLFRSNNADLNATVALALITVFFIQYYGFKYNGLQYLKKFFNLSSPILAFVGILELISEFARILSFAFRLFGNILAGEILITILAAILPSVSTFILLPFFTLELMAGIIQALVFTMISTVLIGMATQKMHH